MFSLETRKTNTKYIVKTISEFILSFFKEVDTHVDVDVTTRKKIGYGIFVLHLLFGTLLIIKLVFNKINIFYVFYTGIWLSILFLNYYFHGCILVKIEKYILQDKFWNGPAEFFLFPLHLFYIPKKDIVNKYVKFFWAIPTTTVMVFKYLFEDGLFYRFIGLLLFGLLAPLIFIPSQSNIFSYLLF
jgi:hypothetical protein